MLLPSTLSITLTFLFPLYSSTNRTRTRYGLWTLSTLIMNRVLGTSLRTVWNSISWLKKELVARKVISYQVQLFQLRFHRLGNMYVTQDLQKLSDISDLPDVALLGIEASTQEASFCVGQIVSIPLFCNKRITYDVPRGPFKRSREWLAAELQLHILEADEPKEPDSDGDDDEPEEWWTPEARRTRARRLLAILPTIFHEKSEEFVLHHGDLNLGNILVDSDHNISGVLDWECVHTVPIWVAYASPKLLQSSCEERHQVPDPDTYGECFDDDTGAPIPNELYVEHQEEYEMTQLRAFYFGEMQRVCPEWMEVYMNNKFKAAFADVVKCLGECVSAGMIDEWINRVEENGTCISPSEYYRTGSWE